MPFYLLLAMQAAGMIVDYLGTSHQSKLMELGGKVQQAGIEANVAQLETQSAMESLESMKNLRRTLGSQIATFAARGTRVGAGSALSIFNESIGNFNMEEKVRKLNVLGKRNVLRGGAALSRLQNMSDISALWNSFGQRTIQRFPTSTKGWGEGINQFKSSFGMTQAG